jgi:nitrogenase molybdenum-iron protein NifN
MRPPDHGEAARLGAAFDGDSERGRDRDSDRDHDRDHDRARGTAAACAAAGDAEPVFHHAVSTRNACKACTPLGACLVFRGVERCLPFLHGSQGCSTYIRRYLISHFREPMDVAASNFSETSAVFGGKSNFEAGIRNVVKGYHPSLIGVATTCLSETIGEDMKLLFRQYREKHWDAGHPEMVHVSTPSYSGTHVDGFRAAVRAITKAFAAGGERAARVNLFPDMVSAADLRYLKEVLEDFALPATVLPDYSDTLDGPSWADYEKLPAGGTTLDEIRALGTALCSITFGRTQSARPSAGAWLEQSFAVPHRVLGLPIGIRESDAFFELLAEAGARPMPPAHARERGRLIDSLVDGHKYVAGQRAVVYGEEDLVIGLASFLCEIGVEPVVCASGGRGGTFTRTLRAAVPELPEACTVASGVDFVDIAEAAAAAKPDFLLGSSKGYRLARSLEVPLVRVGFPIHDRIGGQRVLHLGYRGAQQLFDTIVNTVMTRKQERSDVGYSYL